MEVFQARRASKTSVASRRPQVLTRNKFLPLQRQSSRRRRRRNSKDEEPSDDNNSSSSESSTCDDVPCLITKRLKPSWYSHWHSSYSDTDSHVPHSNMPVGTTNYTLKSSFSLSSLQPGTPNNSPDRGRTERLYHSLTKKSRKSSQLDKDLWRKSWGSGIGHDDKEFWETFQGDYDYLMSQNILDPGMPEIRACYGPGDTPTAPQGWSYSEVLDQFAQLCSWLKGIQESVYSKQENVTDRSLRAEKQEELLRQRFRLQQLNEESRKLVEACPELEEEVSWRVRHVNSKWDTVEALMSWGGKDRKPADSESEEGVDHEVRCLRRWLRDLESKMHPLEFHKDWSRIELEKKMKEHSVLQRDVEGHRKIVTSVVRLCSKGEASNLPAARALERKYHDLYLRSLEWQYHIEGLLARHSTKVKTPVVFSSDSEGEPAAKLARYSWEEDGCRWDEDWLMDTSSPDDSSTTMVGTVATEFQRKATETPESIFGIEESASARALSKSSILGTGSRNANGLLSCANTESELRSPIPAELFEESRRHGTDVTVTTLTEAKSNRVKRKTPNTATIVCKHPDTDSDPEREECPVTPLRSNESIKELVDRADELVSSDKKNERVRRWLDLDKPVGRTIATSDAGCDAGDELTTEDSDFSSEDHDGSVATCRRSGSADGILEERPKSRRPWSIAGVPQLPREADPSKLFWTSESALNRMELPKENPAFRRRKMRSRKRTTNRRSESGSDEVTPSGSSPSRCGKGIVKSGSFSGLVPKGTEEEGRDLDPPQFRIGPEGGSVTVKAVDGEKTGAEEQLSLNSEQAVWDDYQEKYQSEAYSEEPLDSDAAKKLLDWDPDSQSDCASSLSRRRRRSGDDTESDMAAMSDYDEANGSCQQRTKYLDLLLSSRCGEARSPSAKECKDMNNVVERLENMQSKVHEMKMAKQLRKGMAQLKDELVQLAARVQTVETNVRSREDLEAKIGQVKSDLDQVRERKSELLEVNVSVHRYLSDRGHPASTLKDDVADLYRTWDETFQNVSAQLCALQSLSQAWLEFEENLEELRFALESDHNTLRMLDTALQLGSPSKDLAISVRDVVRMLSETEAKAKGTPSGTATPPLLSALSTEGSLSDSGISDSGSEQDLGEREKGLARLKRLARHLESVLAPDSQALLNMSRRIDQAEAELRNLQKTCRDLVSRSVSTSELRINLVLQQSAPPRTPPGKRKGSGSRHTGNPDNEPGRPGKKSWFWRVIRSALPFQLALVALLCVTCLLEPRCCDALNNLGLSLSPQLRYDRGPPPV